MSTILQWTRFSYDDASRPKIESASVDCGHHGRYRTIAKLDASIAAAHAAEFARARVRG
jgi:hypothetical protein